jgi:hypothetical protein
MKEDENAFVLWIETGLSNTLFFMVLWIRSCHAKRRKSLVNRLLKTAAKIVDTVNNPAIAKSGSPRENR